MIPVPPGPDGRTAYLVQVMGRVRSMDGDLSLAIAYDQRAHLALTPAADVHRALGDALAHARGINSAHLVAACLTRGRDPDDALAAARQAAHGKDTDVVTSDSADLAALLLFFLEALRPGPYTSRAGNCRVGLLARGLATAAVYLLPAAFRWRYLAEYFAQMASLPCRAQLAYAFRAASRTRQIRRALTA